MKILATLSLGAIVVAAALLFVPPKQADAHPYGVYGPAVRVRAYYPRPVVYRPRPVVYGAYYPRTYSYYAPRVYAPRVYAPRVYAPAPVYYGGYGAGYGGGYGCRYGW
jgi:hypothetical protein